MLFWVPSAKSGSSLRMRGAPLPLSGHVAQGGIIPADAGSTSNCSLWPSKAAGSSLRMRGALCMALRCGSVGRIIPADAGSTCDIYGDAPSSGDHPCGCGEHVSPVCRSLRHGGSSLRMRGARLGIILAGTVEQDHPCGCGEHRAVADGSFRDQGSSLRMRGARGATA